MPTPADFGWGVASSVVGGAINAGFNTLGAGINYRFNEKAAENADARQRKMYHDLYSPKATLQQLKEAGLSPSMMFGGTPSAGGVSAPQGAGAMGPSFNSGGIDMTQAAAIENIKADTEKKQAEKDLLGQETIAQQLNNYMTQQTMQGNIYKTYLELNVMTAEMQKTIAETEGIDWQNAFNKATEDEQVKALTLKNSNLLKDLAVKNSQIKLNEKESAHFDTIAQKWQMDVYQKFIELDLQQQSVEQQEEWLLQQSEQFYEQLSQNEQFKKLDLKQRKTEMWVNLAADIVKTVVYGGTMIATGGLSGLIKPKPIGFGAR